MIAGGETAGPGDLVVTRRNDRTLRTTNGEPVRNRELWRVDGVGADGSVTLSRQRGQGTVTVPADYARQHLRLGYAATAHGHQGDTVDVSYTLITPGTSHRALYVGATRGRSANHLAVVTDEPDLGTARDILEFALATDQADTPAIAVRRDLHQLGRELQPEQEDPLDAAERAVAEAVAIAGPFEAAVDAAKADLDDARKSMRGLERQKRDAGPIGRLRLRDQLATARLSLERAQDRYDIAVEDASPTRAVVEQAADHRDAVRREQDIERTRQRFNDYAREAASRPVPELGIGL